MGPDSDLLVVHEGEKQYIGGGGYSIQFPGKNFNRFDLVWSVVHGHSPSTDLENEST